MLPAFSHFIITRKTVKVTNICITILIFHISEVSSELCRARTNLTESNDQLHAARREIEKVSSSYKEQAIHIHDLELRLHQTTQERRRYFLFRSVKSYGAKYNHVEIVIRLVVMRYFSFKARHGETRPSFVPRGIRCIHAAGKR